MNDLELVKNIDGQILTSSLTVASVFEKRHDHVIRDIESCISNINGDLEDSPNLSDMRL